MGPQWACHSAAEGRQRPAQRGRGHASLPASLCWGGVTYSRRGASPVRPNQVSSNQVSHLSQITHLQGGAKLRQERWVCYDLGHD